MALIGVNPSVPRQKGPSTLEQIAAGVDIATKILGLGLEGYKTFGRPGKLATETAEANLAKTRAETQAIRTKEPDFSFLDKETIKSWVDNGYSLATSRENDDISPVVLPDSGKTLYFKPTKPKMKESYDLESSEMKSFRTDQGVQNFRTINDATKAVIDSFRGKSVEEDDPARDINLLYNFIRSLDPNSAVKEGEIQLSKDASPLAQTIYLEYKKLKDNKGAVLPAETRKSFISQMISNYNSRLPEYQNLEGQYKDRSQAYGVDWKRVILPLQKIDFSDINKKLNKNIFTDEDERRLRELEGKQ